MDEISLKKKFEEVLRIHEWKFAYVSGKSELIDEMIKTIQEEKQLNKEKNNG